MSFSNNINIKQQTAPILLKEDDKIPLFLIKLWNIVEDPAYYDVIRWDESGYSFHILEPYLFCRNVLPQYFKHNNLNSLIRQLNMYGFRKMTPIERTSLARAESDQDHLEFSHPCFVREHPELLVNIKRKAPAAKQHVNDGTINVPAKDLTAVFEELRALRERQLQMEKRVSDLTKENEIVWQEMSNMRGAHMKQQQIVTKLVQFMVAMLQPSKRIGTKRPILAIDEFQPKRAREADNIPIQAIGSNNVADILDRLMREYTSNPICRNPNMPGPSMGINEGPIIAEVTDELENLAENLPQMNPVPPPVVPPTYSQPQYNESPQNIYYPDQPVSQPTSRRNSMPSNLQRPNINVNPNFLLNSQNIVPPSPQQQVPIVNQANAAPPQMAYIPNINVPINVPTKNDVIPNIPVNNTTPPTNVPEPLINVPNNPLFQQEPQLGEQPPSASNDPLISTPPSTAPPSSLAQELNLSPTEFADYLSSVNNSINNCRSLIGGHWDDLDLDGLLDYDDKSDTGISPRSDRNGEEQQNEDTYNEPQLY